MWGIDVGKVKREDYEVLQYLKKHQPDLYTSMKSQARSKNDKHP